MIGIDKDTGLIYEGRSTWGYGVSPTPLLTPATFIEKQEDWKNVPEGHDLASVSVVFRESSYDPTTRIRRGRLYYANTPSATMQWRVASHPQEYIAPSLFLKLPRVKSLETFLPRRHIAKGFLNQSRLSLAIGAADAISLWKIVSVERGIDGEDLFTLRAQSRLGLLPELDPSRVPVDLLTSLNNCLDKVADGAFRADPVSIVDLCRDAAATVISSWLAIRNNDPHIRTKDLGYLVTALKTAEMHLATDAADLIRRLHPRGKTNEQTRLGIRPPDDEDASLAVSSLGFILRELGWAL